MLGKLDSCKKKKKKKESQLVSCTTYKDELTRGKKLNERPEFIKYLKAYIGGKLQDINLGGDFFDSDYDSKGYLTQAL